MAACSQCISEITNAVSIKICIKGDPFIIDTYDILLTCHSNLHTGVIHKGFRSSAIIPAFNNQSTESIISSYIED